MIVTEDNATEILVRCGYPAFTLRKVLPDGRLAWIVRQMYTNAILVSNNMTHGYDDRWCYELGLPAILALNEWNPEQNAEPTGWIRHPRTGRRRPGGDLSKEYVEM